MGSGNQSSHSALNFDLTLDDLVSDTKAELHFLNVYKLSKSPDDFVRVSGLGTQAGGSWSQLNSMQALVVYL